MWREGAARQRLLFCPKRRIETPAIFRAEWRGSVVRPLDRVLNVLDIAKGPNDQGEYVAFCIAHDDRNTPNLQVRETADSSVLLWCAAGCNQEQVLAAFEEKGVSKSSLFVGRNTTRGGGTSIPPKPTATVQPCTLEAYSEKTRLPVAFLRRLKLSDMSYMGTPAVRIPYLREDGAEGAVRFRVALGKSPEGNDRFRWRKGSKPILYGLWRIHQAREAGYAFLVEGESDCHTLWHHGLPALGVPGASNWRKEWAEELDGIEKVYAVVEPDQGGEAFWERLAAAPLRERLYRVELEVPDGEG